MNVGVCVRVCVCVCVCVCVVHIYNRDEFNAHAPVIGKSHALNRIHLSWGGPIELFLVLASAPRLV